MSLAVVRRGTALGLVLVLAVAATALADTLRPDADDALTGAQSSYFVGEVAPGAEASVDVDFVLECKLSSHLTAGATLAVDETSRQIPDGTTLDVTAGQVIVPADWPAPGGFCTGNEGAAVVTPAHLALTAPMSPGVGYSYSVFFGLPEGETITNMIAVTIYLDVVVPNPPPDTTAPAIHGLPADIETSTATTSAAVTWQDPSATDDTDPNPTVGCVPASGSSFNLGTTTVTCTATDASDNSSTASFKVTVTQAQPALVGTWGRPLSDAVPSLVGHTGRTIPLKLDVTAAGQRKGPGQISAPVLLAQGLSRCAANADTTSMLPGGTFSWQNGQWQLSFDTTGFGSGCVRLVARVDGTTAATSVIQLVPDALISAKGKP
jgi:hypothetical protein